MAGRAAAVSSGEHRLTAEKDDRTGAVAAARGASRWLVPVIVTVVALVIAYRMLGRVDHQAVLRELRALAPMRIAVALLCTAASYLALATLDVLALRYAGATLPVRRTALASLSAYALSHAFGFAVLTGSAVRYRLYSSWGIERPRILRAIAFNAMSFWVGILGATGIVLALTGRRLGALSHIAPAASIAISAVCLLAVGAYLALAALPRRHSIFGLELPSLAIAGAQAIVAIADWMIAGAVLLAVISHAGTVPPLVVLGVFVLGQAAGLISHVPGGLGVFEATVVALLDRWISPVDVLAALIAYRAIYYALPLAVAVVLLLLDAASRYRDILHALRFRVRRALANESSLAPEVLAIAVFVGGAVLLFSGATPPVSARMRLLHDVSPTPLIEGAYFLASLTGVALLLAARGLWRRVDGARLLAIILLIAGITLSVLKGLDFEEASYLAVVLAFLLPARRCFPRRAALLTVDFSWRWLTAMAIVVASSVWLLFFSYSHVLYSGGVWWHFAVAGGASRALRATVGAAVVAVMAAIARLLRPVQPMPPLPGPSDLARAARIIAGNPETPAHLALLGDKALLFNDAGTAFLMYSIAGQTWVALGDPVGPAGERAGLARRFRELAERHGGRPVFYQGSPASLPFYVELGLTPFKLGECARVSLADFSLEGGHRKWLRRARRVAVDAGCAFAIVPTDAVPEILPALRQVSDDWLAAKRTREKGFSLGFYDEAYLREHPIAIVRRHGAIIAFANIWAGNRREELSIDLMRYSSEAPPGVTDYMLCELLLWGHTVGYRWFDLGMAPLSGLSQDRFAPLWNRVGGFVYRRGTTWYNFQGLRSFKEKFDPVWEPRYLAAPGRAGAAAAVPDVTALVSRGLSGAVRQ